MFLIYCVEYILLKLTSPSSFFNAATRKCKITHADPVCTGQRWAGACRKFQLVVPSAGPEADAHVSKNEAI